MDVAAIESFADWFRDNSGELAKLRSQMAVFESAAGLESEEGEAAGGSVPEQFSDFEAIFGSFEELVSPYLEAIDEGLSFEVGPGERKAHVFVISAGGLASRVPTVKAIVQQMPELPEWEFVAFKPARPITPSAALLVGTQSGEQRIDARDIRCSLTQESTKVGVTLYFHHFDEEEYESFGQAAFHFLDFALGEYSVIEGVGSVSLDNILAAGADSFPLADLPRAFAAAADAVRRAYAELLAQPAEERRARLAELLNDDFTQLDEAVHQESATEVVNVSVQLWAPHEECVDDLLTALPDFEAEIEERPCLLGDGFRIILSGPAARAGFTAESWIEEAIVPHLAREAVIEAVAEQEVPHPFFAQLQVQQLLEEGDFERAVRLLSQVLAKYGDDDDGTLLALLGNCYLRAGELDQAAEAYEGAIAIAQDDDVVGEILTNKGNALQQAGDLEGAIDCFTRALGYDQENFIRHYNLGQALAQKGAIDGAVDHIGRALELNPEILGHVLEDEDLNGLRETAEFRSLVGKFHY